MKYLNRYLVAFFLCGLVVYLFVESKEKKILEASVSSASLQNTNSTKTAFQEVPKQLVNQVPVTTQRSQTSKSDQIDQLSSTKNPRDAYKAFQMVNACIQHESTSKVVLKPSELAGDQSLKDALALEEQQNAHICDGISQRQRDDRFKNLDVAIKGGVRGAATDYLNSGPLGDVNALVTRKTDPLVVEWKKQAVNQLEQTAKQGDLTSLMTLSNLYQSGEFTDQNQQLALTYAVANTEIRKNKLGDSIQDTNRLALMNNYINAMSVALTKEQIIKATSDGQKFATECCFTK
ncbi:hypothetical protein QN372_10080 [Undibacterium sp. RTI2.1]|uniref:hypothetical protein n=1 Tax=unclassified Undibacterium TaxID=2630295 RepID=UPI002AB426EF|nr:MULTISPECIES: hypothetical protein [unclassified Undibacterium]MDY7540232.1 hypothetical protein [Undibacterium sp. 5I1]MEB0031095.1 hypothetical protein [Undibacterium sp. RTI2.1]MEB0115313.1 hypothetical protein [Undibacterium sp. RTI2.2]MEB0231412.1 hypothetical protein [Undibacterium sp. 10I3]MEB0257159.1 hypothetical protein [Undibacterium sp. 5I1]